MDKLVIGLTGHIGAGKGSVGTHLAKQYGASVYPMSAFFRWLFSFLPFKFSPKRPLYSLVSITLKRTMPRGYLARWFIRRMREDKAEILVIDGVRYVDDLLELKRVFPRFVLLAIDADEVIRFARVRKRTQYPEEKEMTAKAFRAAQDLASEREIQRVMIWADATINNNGSPEELCASVDHLMMHT